MFYLHPIDSVWPASIHQIYAVCRILIWCLFSFWLHIHKLFVLVSRKRTHTQSVLFFPLEFIFGRITPWSANHKKWVENGDVSRISKPLPFNQTHANSMTREKTNGNFPPEDAGRAQWNKNDDFWFVCVRCVSWMWLHSTLLSAWLPFAAFHMHFHYFA